MSKILGVRGKPLTVVVALGLGFALTVPGLLLFAYSVSTLSAPVNAGSGHGLGPPLAGVLLFNVAFFALVLSQCFVVWVDWVRPSGALGGFYFLRQAQRKINGDDPSGMDMAYGTQELSELRALAEDRVARSRSRLRSWAARIGAGALVAVYLGVVLAPPSFGSGVVADASAQAFRYLSVVVVLVGVVEVLRTWRMSTDMKAQAFLDRTASSASD